MGRAGLRKVAALPLAPPAGAPEGCTLRLQGLAVSSGSNARGGQLAAWVLLAAAQLGAAAPFLSAALSSRIYGSSKQQLWLCRYDLPGAAAGAASLALPSSAGAVGASCGPAAGNEPQAEAEGLHQGAAMSPTVACEAEAAAAAGVPLTEDAVEAVLALQQAVAGLRQEMRARLDSLDTGLADLLRSLQAGRG